MEKRIIELENRIKVLEDSLNKCCKDTCKDGLDKGFEDGCCKSDAGACGC